MLPAKLLTTQELQVSQYSVKYPICYNYLMARGSTSISSDELARMIQNDVVSKMATKDQFKLLVDEIRLLRDDIKDLVTSNRSLVSLVALHDKQIRELNEHVGLHD